MLFNLSHLVKQVTADENSLVFSSLPNKVIGSAVSEFRARLFSFCKPLQSYMLNSHNTLLFDHQWVSAISACCQGLGRPLDVDPLLL